ncbi:hypothetical protein IE53DRAFT_32196 [Violaceomyces palustris]|uniref:Uncharacterized protein n=1 Tax=Violaceomyces palustris TaxID=1673888 RepID=A0ACD0P7I9_9BASI|nr:hypothetical protein IE53DRAFT_32196 [Violaceomyces palustris]
MISLASFSFLHTHAHTPPTPLSRSRFSQLSFLLPWPPQPNPSLLPYFEFRLFFLIIIIIHLDLFFPLRQGNDDPPFPSAKRRWHPKSNLQRQGPTMARSRRQRLTPRSRQR